MGKYNKFRKIPKHRYKFYYFFASIEKMYGLFLAINKIGKFSKKINKIQMQINFEKLETTERVKLYQFFSELKNMWIILWKKWGNLIFFKLKSINKGMKTV